MKTKEKSLKKIAKSKHHMKTNSAFDSTEKNRNNGLSGGRNKKPSDNSSKKFKNITEFINMEKKAEKEKYISKNISKTIEIEKDDFKPKKLKDTDKGKTTKSKIKVRKDLKIKKVTNMSQEKIPNKATKTEKNSKKNNNKSQENIGFIKTLAKKINYENEEDNENETYKEELNTLTKKDKNNKLENDSKIIDNDNDMDNIEEEMERIFSKGNENLDNKKKCEQIIEYKLPIIKVVKYKKVKKDNKPNKENIKEKKNDEQKVKNKSKKPEIKWPTELINVQTKNEEIDDYENDYENDNEKEEESKNKNNYLKKIEEPKKELKKDVKDIYNKEEQKIDYNIIEPKKDYYIPEKKIDNNIPEQKIDYNIQDQKLEYYKNEKEEKEEKEEEKKEEKEEQIERQKEEKKEEENLEDQNIIIISEENRNEETKNNNENTIDNYIMHNHSVEVRNREKSAKSSKINSIRNSSMNKDMNNTQIKENKKEKKAYLRFIQNIKKANKNKLNKTKNMFQADPKMKLVKAVKKMNLLNKAFINTYKNIHLQEEKEKRKKEEEILKQIENITKPKDNAYDNTIEEEKTGYTGFVLLKQNKGANIFQIKLEGTLEQINAIFKKNKIEIDGGQVELIHTKELEKLRNKNENSEKGDVSIRIENETINNSEMKEVREEPILAVVRKKAMEADNVKRDEDNIRIKEMKERILKYKKDLRKGTDTDEYRNPKRKRLSYHEKREEYIGKKLKEIIAKKNEDPEFNSIGKKQTMEKNRINLATSLNKEAQKFFRENEEKKQITIANNENDMKKEEKKEEQDKREKSYSRAMDRFKKKYKKENNSVDTKTQKSNKINEMAKRLENVIGKPSADNNNENAYPEKQKERHNNFEEIIESKPVVAKKRKKMKKFEL